MADNTALPPSGGPVSQPERRSGSVLVPALLIVVGSVVLGLVGGLVWAAIAPKVVYQVYTLHPPTAYAVNPETSAFIAADGAYCFIAIGGGALIGLLSYVFGVRRYGPVPMIAAVTGATIAAFVTKWVGHLQTGGSGFDQVLASARPGQLLHAPIMLGAHGALAFWPLAAALVAGGLELIGVLRARHQEAYHGMPQRAWQDPVRPHDRGAPVDGPGTGESGSPPS